VKHGGSVSVTARQQTFCARNLEQGGGEFPASTGSDKGKIMERFKELLRRNAGETLDRDDP